jgi:iron complex outermembrane recepter protein
MCVSRGKRPSRARCVQPFVAVTNALDSRYSASVVINAFGGRYHEPGPGRSLLLGLDARFR